MAINRHIDEENDDMILKPDLDIIFSGKSSLKRSEESGILLEDEKAVAMLEGDKAMDAGLASVVELFAKTKLQPDNSIIFPDHASLKKRVVIIPAAIRYPAAAVILILISLSTWIYFSPEVNHAPIRHELARLESISSEFRKQSQQPHPLDFRASGSIQLNNVPRQLIQLSRLDGQSPGMISIPATLANSYAELQPRQSNIQHPPSNPSNSLSTGTQEFAMNEEPRKKSLMGKVFSGIFNRSEGPARNDYPEAKPGTQENFSLWNIAKLGIKGVNAMGDHDYTVVRDYNQKGKVKGIIVVDE